jgi:Kef-type K+ transport system membrane component KefB
MTFGTLFLIGVAALMGPILSGNRLLALPIVAGEILAGIIIGHSGFKLIDPADPTLQFFASVGFAMLLFVVGTRLPISHVLSGISGPARRGFVAAILTLAASIPCGFALAHLTGVGHPVMFMLLCAASSSSTVLPILAERKIQGAEASALTVWIPIADIATMCLLPLAFGIGSAISIVEGCAVVAGAGIGAFLSLKYLRQTDTIKRYRQLSKERAWALDMRVMLVVLFGLAWLATKFNTSVLVAGFVAGLTSALIGQPKRFTKQVTGLAEGLFVPLFFVVVGARIDLFDFIGSTANLQLAGMVLAGGLLAHLVGALVSRLPLSTGLIASQHMGLPAAIVSMGLTAGVLNPGQAGAIICAALFSLAVCLIGIKRLPRTPPGDDGSKTKPNTDLAVDPDTDDDDDADDEADDDAVAKPGDVDKGANNSTPPASGDGDNKPK